jgi:hypothetical protein
MEIDITSMIIERHNREDIAVERKHIRNTINANVLLFLAGAHINYLDGTVMVMESGHKYVDGEKWTS